MNEDQNMKKGLFNFVELIEQALLQSLNVHIYEKEQYNKNKVLSNSFCCSLDAFQILKPQRTMQLYLTMSLKSYNVLRKATISPYTL